MSPLHLPFAFPLSRPRAIFRQDLPPIPRWLLRLASTAARPRAYRAPSYRAVHNPEGLITYSSRERESSRYGATHKLISPAPRSPRLRGVGGEGEACPPSSTSGSTPPIQFHLSVGVADYRGRGPETRGMPWRGPPSLPSFALLFLLSRAISTGMETSIEGHTKLGSSRAITLADRR